MKSARVAPLVAAISCALALNTQALAQITEKVVYSFGSTGDFGAFPEAGLIHVKGTLYGTAFAGGRNGVGTVFSFDLRTHTAKALVYFGQDLPGWEPVANLIDVKGILYGTASSGGNPPGGIIFSIDPATGTSATIHSFRNYDDGRRPAAGLIAVNGTLYGTTAYGGGLNNGCGDGCGTVYALAPATGNESVAYSFVCRHESCANGEFPLGSLIHENGLFYATASLGGTYGYGTVISLDATTGSSAVLHAFGSGSDGQVPTAGLTALNGALYGTTSVGGGTSCKGEGYGSGCGTVFALDPMTGAETVLHEFGGSDGEYPHASLLAVNGMLYGTTVKGGASDAGTVFSIDPASGALTTLHSFGSGADGANPYASLIDVNGTLYGTTEYGGSVGSGTIFSLKNF